MANVNLILIASALLSLLFSYVPGFKDWFDGLDVTKKRGMMALMLLASAIGIFAYGCAGRLPSFACDVNSAWELAGTYVLAIMANQTTYELLGKFGKTVEVRLPVSIRGATMTSLDAVYDSTESSDKEVTVEADIKENNA